MSGAVNTSSSLPVLFLPIHRAVRNGFGESKDTRQVSSGLLSHGFGREHESHRSSLTMMRNKPWCYATESVASACCTRSRSASQVHTLVLRADYLHTGVFKKFMENTRTKKMHFFFFFFAPKCTLIEFSKKFF